MTLPRQVRLVEVGPRDGLQNEKPLSTQDKVELINQLAEAGMRHIEAGSFVSPKWVPQMADSDEIFARIKRHDGVTYAALTPNMKGFEKALAAKVDEVAIFAAASEGFSQKNINCSIADSLARFTPIMAAAKAAGLPVRGYVSCVIGCPYDGPVAPQKVAEVTARLLEMGCYEVSLGDTIGTGTAADVSALLDSLCKVADVNQLAVHFHDTYGQALTNIHVALQYGIATIDCAVAGLGGCPYAAGASGNVASEDVVYLLNGLGIAHGVDLEKLAAAGDFICRRLQRSNGSKVARALLANKNNTNNSR